MNRRLLPLFVASFFALTACATPGPGDPPTASPTGETSAPDREPSQDADGEGDAQDESPRALEVTVGSEVIEFEPTDVYCKVGGGELRHFIAKTDNRPPLLEVVPGEFAMLKIQQSGAPEKSNSPSGLEYSNEGIVFSDAQIGDAVVNGPLLCTQTEGQ